MKYINTFFQEIGEGLQAHEAFRGRKVRFQVALLLLLTLVFCLAISCLFTLYGHL